MSDAPSTEEIIDKLCQGASDASQALDYSDKQWVSDLLLQAANRLEAFRVGPSHQAELYDLAEKMLRLLYQCYAGISAVIRLGYPLDDSWPQEAQEAFDAVGDFLYADIDPPINEQLQALKPELRAGRPGDDRDGSAE